MVTGGELLRLMSPVDGTSLFYKVLIINGLTSLKISFDRTAYSTQYLTIDFALGKFNSPADDYWTLLIKYSRLDEMVVIPLVYNYTGQIDMNRTTAGNLSAANALLNPVIGELQLLASQFNITLDIWEFINWIYVNFYWTMLSDLGQIAPINYRPRPPTPLTRLMTVDFNDRQPYNPRYNTLLNTELFKKQTDYLTNTLLPLLNQTAPVIQPLRGTNIYSPELATFVRSYICEIRQWKDPLSFIFSVLTTISVFTMGPLTFFRFVFTWWDTHRHPMGLSLPNDVNFSKYMSLSKLPEHSPVMDSRLRQRTGC